MAAAFASLERGRKQGRNGRERLVLTITSYVAELIDELNCCVVLMEEQALEPEDRAKLVQERDKFERSCARSSAKASPTAAWRRAIPSSPSS
jgi:TetR/AcrR family transcriptional regulator